MKIVFLSLKTMFTNTAVTSATCVILMRRFLEVVQQHILGVLGSSEKRLKIS